jgi:hypothetical protein
MAPGHLGAFFMSNSPILDSPETQQVETQRLRALLSREYNQHLRDTPREWALFFELRNATGGAAETTNYVDALALNLWKSKRFRRVAYEFKVSRADFLKELSKPEKRQWAWDISHEFWFVCAPGVAKKEEIPEGCGLLQANADGTKLTRLVVAKQRQPRDLRIEEIASMARRLTEAESMSSLRWQLAGKELDATELEQLLDEKLAAHRDQRIQEQVDARVAEAVQKIQDRLDLYVIQMEKVGIEPPAWMKDFQPDAKAETSVDRWVEKNIHPGPNAQEVRDAFIQQKRCVSDLEEALEHARKAGESLKAMLKRKGEDLAQPVPETPVSDLEDL